MRIALRIITALIGLYASWMFMLITHEAGHVLLAWCTGGKVLRVEMPLLGFSQTIVDPNPAPLIVASGGFIGGVVLPLVLILVIQVFRKPPRMVWFFVGFCLVANGGYLAGSAMIRAGDGRELLRLGLPKPLMIVTGCGIAICGIWLWHITRCLTFSRRPLSASPK